MTIGLIVLLAAVALALGVGGHRAVVDGRFRRPTPTATDAAAAPGRATVPELAAGGGLTVALGERATLLQFSSAFCAPCRATRRVLGDVARLVPGVSHVEVDAEQHLELVRRLGVVRTPTTLLLDEQGHEVTRAAGAPEKRQVLGALAGMPGVSA